MGLDIDYRPYTQSMASTFNWCQMKYYYQYVYGIVPTRIHMPYLVGGAIHIGVPSLLKYKDLKKAKNDALSYTDKFKADYEKNHTMSADEDQEFIYQQINISCMIENYYHFHQDFIKKVKVLFLERILQSKEVIKSDVFISTSKVDALIKFDNKKYVYELKSTKSPSFESIMAYYAQIMSYFLVASTKYNLDGVYIDGIKKPQLKVGKNEQIEDYMKRLEENYKSEDNFYHDYFKPNNRHLKQFQELMQDTERRILIAEKEKKFIHNRFMCRVYGNCEYLLLCDNGENELTMRKYRKTISANEELEED